MQLTMQSVWSILCVKATSWVIELQQLVLQMLVVDAAAVLRQNSLGLLRC